jgi:phage repressor protein C with HTH and peptisase S24 domain
MDGRNWGFNHASNRTCAAQTVDDGDGFGVHAMTIATIATKSQAKKCDNRFCDPVAIAPSEQMDIDWLKSRLEARGIRQIDLAEALGIEPDKVSKVFAGKRRWQGDEALKLAELLASHDDSSRHPDVPPAGRENSYVDIAVLPSFAGMGGGGNGEGERGIAKLPRDLIEDQLHGRSGDFELIDVRGDSMEPDFHHGDQILIDRRDRDPRQPGPFALWDDDGYVVKLVERIPGKRGWYRVFSANPRYSSYEVEEHEATIRGRPVWFARRL